VLAEQLTEPTVVKDLTEVTNEPSHSPLAVNNNGDLVENKNSNTSEKPNEDLGNE